MRKQGMYKRVGVLMGGPSCERDISIKSGKAVCKALLDSGIDTVPIELSGNTDKGDYGQFVKQKLHSNNIDVVFIALHGKFGEDGNIQEILEGINIPYTGSKVNASRLGMDKISAKDVFKANNIPAPSQVVLRKNQPIMDISIDPPLVIKPSDEGSSIGLSIVDSHTDLQEAIDNAFKYSDTVLIEEYIEGRELTVGILEDEVLPIVEIVPKRRFFDFSAKYQEGLTEYIVPAKICKAEYDECRNISLLAHKSLGAFFFSRVDIILNKKGVPIVLELNTIPGLTEMSLLPRAAMSAGISFRELILKILGSACYGKNKKTKGSPQ